MTTPSTPDAAPAAEAPPEDRSSHAPASDTWSSQALCPQCGYSLAGHAAPLQCPECGEDFRGLPGGVSWFAGERVRLACFAAVLLALTLLVLAAISGETLFSEASQSLGYEFALFARMSGGSLYAKLSLFGMVLAGLLLWAASPRPRVGAVLGALVMCLVQPTVVILCEAYISSVWVQQAQMAAGFGRGSPGFDATLFFLSAAGQFSLPITLCFLLLLVCRHLRVMGLTSLADRSASWVRPAMIALPLLVVIDRAVLYTVGPGASATPFGGGRPAPGALGGFEILVGALGPIHTALTTALMLVAAYGAVRLWLRLRWTIEASRILPPPVG